MKPRIPKVLGAIGWTLGIALAMSDESPHSLLERVNKIYNRRIQAQEDIAGDWNSTKGTNRPTYQITDPQVLSVIEALQSQ
jgi:hypothetical protein